MIDGYTIRMTVNPHISADYTLGEYLGAYLGSMLETEEGLHIYNMCLTHNEMWIVTVDKQDFIYQAVHCSMNLAISELKKQIEQQQ